MSVADQTVTIHWRGDRFTDFFDEVAVSRQQNSDIQRP